MQINGASSCCTSIFSPKLRENDDPVRLPAVIDDKLESYGLTEIELLPSVDETKPFQTTFNDNSQNEERDQQQAQFVRLSAELNELSTNDAPAQAALAFSPPVPTGVQQYIQIENLESEPQQRLIDETV